MLKTRMIIRLEETNLALCQRISKRKKRWRQWVIQGLLDGLCTGEYMSFRIVQVFFEKINIRSSFLKFLPSEE